MENRQSGWRRKRKREYISTVSRIFKNFFFSLCQQQFEVAATAASPHPCAPYIHRSFPCLVTWLNPPPPLTSLSVSILLCVHFLSPYSYILFLHCLYSTHLFYFFSLSTPPLTPAEGVVKQNIFFSWCLARVLVTLLVYSLQEYVISPYL